MITFNSVLSNLPRIQGIKGLQPIYNTKEWMQALVRMLLCTATEITQRIELYLKYAYTVHAYRIHIIEKVLDEYKLGAVFFRHIIGSKVIR